MHNYEHEIPCPSDRAIHTFLWYDYFHDSYITGIEFHRAKAELRITLYCNREIGQNRRSTWNEFRAWKEYKPSIHDNYRYELSFKGVEYIGMEAEDTVVASEYINGRFKNSALLRSKQSRSKTSLFHIRLQLSEGYCDIVFNRFIVKKVNGRVRYISDSHEDTRFDPPTPTDIERDSLMNEGIDDYDSFFIMAALYRLKDPMLLDIARRAIRLATADADSRLYSCYLLGKLGDSMDIPALLDRYRDACNSNNMDDYVHAFHRKIILDAIEEIMSRSR